MEQRAIRPKKNVYKMSISIKNVLVLQTFTYYQEESLKQFYCETVIYIAC